jgi:hypothetical protein
MTGMTLGSVRILRAHVQTCAGCLGNGRCWVCLGTGRLHGRAGYDPCHRCNATGHCVEQPAMIVIPEPRMRA